MSSSIRRMTSNDLPRFQAHFARHRAESGRGGHHFMPFAPDDLDGPKGLDAEALDRPLSEPGWQRWFLAFADNGNVVGHGNVVGNVDLKGGGLRAGLHRCELGIGIERPYRGAGLGQRLMETAIGFALEAESLAWIDLSVFVHNSAARALYKKLGFVEVGTIVDRFRIAGTDHSVPSGGTSIDDVLMALSVSGRR